MAPEAAVLSLHAHHHTVDAVETQAAGQHDIRQHWSQQHRHCHTEQLYDAAFQPALPPGLPVAAVQPTFPAYRVAAPGRASRHLLRGAALRGPPVS
ncbi:hypothetical protein D0N36_14790 [Hymenobacter lapidiphilus]|nr:hypothetical protein D0N36_14790 [Hymenobacter sp. CCM 8763]